MNCRRNRAKSEVISKKFPAISYPNTYAFYGDDQHKRSYGQVRWVARQQAGSASVVTTGKCRGGTFH
jgi:hypothetical protein